MIRRRTVLGAGLAPLLAGAAPNTVLRCAINQLPSPWGNPFLADGTPNAYSWNALFDGLTRLQGDFTVGPSLALSWRRVDPTVWRFTMRPDVRFSNGEPFDAAAAAATFQWLATAPGRATLMGARFRAIVGATVRDAATLDLTTTQPDSILPQRLATLAIVAPRAWAQLGPSGFALKPEGSGPYRIRDWGQTTRRADMLANPHAFRPARTPRLSLYELPETPARVQALMSGDVDLAMVGIDDLDLLTARGYRHVIAPAMQVMSFGFITEGRPSSPLRDVRVRRALNLAVDKAALAGILLRGLSRPAGQPAAHITFGHDPAIAAFPYDPAAAKALLAQAGFARGFPLSIAVVPNALPADTQIYQAAASDLRRVGIDVDLRAITFSDWLAQFVSGRWRTDAAGMAWNAAAFNDAIRPMENFSCKKPNPYFCDKAMMPLFQAVEAAEGPARLAALQRLARAFHETAPALFLVEQIDIWAFRRGLSGVRLVSRAPAYEDVIV